MSLKREDILKASDIKTEGVHVPEWVTKGDDVVNVRGLTGKGRDKFEAGIVGDRLGKGSKIDMRNLRAKLAAECMVDDEGNLLFSEADVELLGEKSAAALERVFDAARRLSGMTQEDVEELAGNLKSGPKGNFISA